MQVLPLLGDRFLRILQQGEEVGPGDVSDLKDDEFDRARSVALEHMIEMRSGVERDARKLNDALVSSRLASLERTYEAKSRRVQGYLAKAYEPRIRRMRQAQLRNLEARFEADKAELEARRAVTTTFSIRLAGVLRLSSKSV
jgi:hypothetical protein